MRDTLLSSGTRHLIGEEQTDGFVWQWGFYWTEQCQSNKISRFGVKHLNDLGNKKYKVLLINK